MTDVAALLDDATRRQRRAADPGASVWVAASAGTGKTKVLTDRVLALLLAGVAPHRILCLTFTKAAAAEMSTRIATRLAEWATAGDSRLAGLLAELVEGEPDAATLTTARRLFARVLDVPGGMHIETIHAFCQSLLRRFPLEAGLAPHFQVMDDRDAGEMLEAAKEEVLGLARDGADTAVAAALAEVTGRVHETMFPEVMAELAADRGRLKRLFDRTGGIEGVASALRDRMGLEPGATPDTILAAACAETAFAGPALRAAAEALMAGSDTDARRGRTIAAWLADPTGRTAGFAAYAGAYLAQKGTILKTLATKKVAAIPGVLAALETEAERLLRVTARLKSARVLHATLALLTLGGALLGAYERRKQAAALMDYDDLILAARDLLARPGVAPWVLFKLDGGIDHLLIDEAQDTNPDQWAVVAALAEEFFAGAGARDRVRTVFAVGDVKQSIYSFQRADPRAFEAMRAGFARRVPEAERDWREIPLNLSFRSGQAVIDAVNRVFAPGSPARDGVAGDEDITHLARRLGQAGLVEVWPPVEPRPLDAPAPWKPPVERIRGDSPQARLAGLLARRIGAMIATERLDSQDRPVRAGDVMVLVRRRGPFVEDLVRALKAEGVAVAGADRMVLTEQMAVMDLMALGNALLLPEDDLTLAAVLKGPLVGLSEDELFRLAWNRGEAGLWETLRRRVGEEPAFNRAWETLSGLAALADRLTPHDLFAHVLGPLGGRRALLARLGIDAEDPLDEFMALTLAYERAHAPSLQGFLRWLETGAVEIKRDLEQGGQDAVRIMTVHGSKGLQAPIVILPDTLQAPTRGPKLLWSGEAEAELPLWPPSADHDDEVCAAARQAHRTAREREYRRLLYVALTRAEDRLIVCGWETRKAAPAGCWYNLVRDALSGFAAEAEDPFLAEAGETRGATVLRLACRQQAEPDRRGDAPDALAAPGALPLPDWTRRAPPPEPAPPKPLAPSRPDGEEPPVRSPLGPDRTRRFRRGKLIHRLLQILPELPADRRSAAAIAFLRRAGIDDAAECLAIAGEVADVLLAPAFAPLFGPGSRAEVPIIGLIGDSRAVSGQVDRLVVTGTEVLVADYKTNRRPPPGPADIPELYVRQMAAYRLALACIYPRHRVRCALVWTDGPALMEIDSARLDDALGSL
ncbi:double-strand break repair helicase AddA [Magnetospirillum sp. UT-4]|uniref:double-strand break repair helicase AddA n=1 Tax=Magnetospirillum sp. UT-4 TaxID=2681467 RepID=UPI00137CDD36|nr:double-strand break repair helicase AddA [Magnetospirillum sp. UT-4]CAA7624308.1 UvrD/REP helicase [Magnetospirillum sp. UT-4]